MTTLDTLSVGARTRAPGLYARMDPTVRHVATVTRAFDDGHTESWMLTGPAAPETAWANLRKRWRDAQTPHTADRAALTLTQQRTEPVPCTETVTYTAPADTTDARVKG